jgi:hypothetical protein
MSINEYLEPFRGKRFEIEIVPSIEQAINNQNWRPIENVINKFCKSLDLSMILETEKSTLFEYYKKHKNNYLKISKNKKIDEELAQFFSLVIRGSCVPLSKLSELEVEINVHGYGGFIEFINQLSKVDKSGAGTLLKKFEKRMPLYFTYENDRAMMSYTDENDSKKLYKLLERIENEGNINFEGSRDYILILLDALEKMTVNGFGLIWSMC